MRHCSLYEVCGLNALPDPDFKHCILHSTKADKNKREFHDALNRHLTERGRDNFRGIVFPEPANFADVEFDKADFSDAIFRDDAIFRGTVFIESACFDGAIFEKRAFFADSTFPPFTRFVRAKFNEDATFWRANFARNSMFNWCVFGKEVYFSSAKFVAADFPSARFKAFAEFDGTIFSESANFNHCWFLGRTVFAATEDPLPVFLDVRVDFQSVVIEPLDAVTFRNADLRQFRFRDTDLRKVEFVGVRWPRIGRRQVVYDEIASAENKSAAFFLGVERLYRQLKQNYDDRKDYERVAEFHYGEKEMRRKNPGSGVIHRVFLTLYWILSGYGERYVRPLLWGTVVLLLSTFLYLVLGIFPRNSALPLSPFSVFDWARAVHYSFRVMTLLKPDDLTLSETARIVNTVQTIAGPLILGLFALAVRQHLKR